MMESSKYKSVGETYKTKDKFAQLDQETFLLLKKLGYQPKVIFDIGASDGSWSKDIYEILSESEFHLFEPLIDYSQAYSAIIQDNLNLHSSFRLHKLALGEQSGEIIINAFADSVVSSTALDIANTGLQTTPVKVKMLTLDEAIKSLDLPIPQVIKIDTQGYELSILKGAQKTLPNVDILCLECWFYRGYGKHTPLLSEIADWLLQFNFRIWDIGDTYRGENNVLATLDCVFVNTKAGLTPDWYYA